MSRFKKCEMWMCDRTATKKIAIYPKKLDEQIGGRFAFYQTDGGRHGNIRGYDEVRKKVKRRVCSYCYEHVRPDDLRIGYENDEESDVYIERL